MIWSKELKKINKFSDLDTMLFKCMFLVPWSSFPENVITFIPFRVILLTASQTKWRCCAVLCPPVLKCITCTHELYIVPQILFLWQMDQWACVRRIYLIFTTRCPHIPILWQCLGLELRERHYWWSVRPTVNMLSSFPSQSLLLVLGVLWWAEVWNTKEPAP